MELAACRFGDPPPADRTGRTAAALVHQPHHDAGPFGLVPQRPKQVGAAPLPQPQVVGPTDIPLGDPLGITHQQGPHPPLDSEGDRLLGGLMLGLVDAATMARLDAALLGAVAAPAARTPLPGPGRSSGRSGLPCLLVVQVQPTLGAQRPPGDQQPGLLGDDRVGVDDAKVDPGNPTWIQIMLLDRDGGGDRQPQPPASVEQGDGADLLGRVGDRAGQPHPQRWAASGDRQPHPLAVQLEGAVVEPDRNQGVLAAREAGLLLSLTAPVGRGKPGI
jgi:hypothetical protein